jgi:hypothetical protein
VGASAENLIHDIPWRLSVQPYLTGLPGTSLRGPRALRPRISQRPLSSSSSTPDPAGVPAPSSQRSCTSPWDTPRYAKPPLPPFSTAAGMPGHRRGFLTLVAKGRCSHRFREIHRNSLLKRKSSFYYLPFHRLESRVIGKNPTLSVTPTGSSNPKSTTGRGPDVQPTCRRCLTSRSTGLALC